MQSPIADMSFLRISFHGLGGNHIRRHSGNQPGGILLSEDCCYLTVPTGQCTCALSWQATHPAGRPGTDRLNSHTCRLRATACNRTPGSQDTAAA